MEYLPSKLLSIKDNTLESNLPSIGFPDFLVNDALFNAITDVNLELVSIRSC
jgi:hypothetical protein